MVSLFDGELGALIPRTLCDFTVPIDGESESIVFSRTEVQEWELVDSRCLQHRGSIVPHSPFHLFALQVKEINIEVGNKRDPL